jgi:hypothetical protein
MAPVGAPRRLFLQEGQRFGDGTVVIPDLGVRSPRKALLVCDCGQQYSAAIGNLNSGNTKSCGCRKTGGLRAHPLRGTWFAMKYRCENPRHEAYERYGGRGIRVCEEWQDFTVFASDIDRLIGPRPDRHTLDRIDNDGDYKPGNVRWADYSTQARNRPQLRKLSEQDGIICAARRANGESVSALAREYGVHSSVMSRRIHGLMVIWEEFWRAR